MVLFISTWVRQSPSTGTNQSSPMDSPTPQDTPQPSCSYRRQERTPYWEWIRSNPSDSLSPSSGSNTTSDDSEEDDYAFYYSHPERIIYHNHSPVHVARRRLCRASAAAPTRRAFFRANQHERDSLATMVDDDAHDREHDYGFDQASLSCGSVGSDDTAAEDEQYIETLKDDVDNASLSTDQQEQDHPLAAKFDGFKERRRHRHKPKSKTPAATPSCTTKTLGSLGSGAKDGHEVKQDPVPAAHDGLRLRKSLSRLSIFRLFNSSERTP